MACELYQRESGDVEVAHTIVRPKDVMSQFIISHSKFSKLTSYAFKLWPAFIGKILVHVALYEMRLAGYVLLPVGMHPTIFVRNTCTCTPRNKQERESPKW